VCGGSGSFHGKDCFDCDGQGWKIVKEEKDINKEDNNIHGIG